VHVVLDGSPEAVLEKLGLAPRIREAIVARKGELGALLLIAEVAGKGGDAAPVAAAAGFEALTPDLLSELNLSAAAWFGAHLAEPGV
jgi:EAL and modified HD-GYP domain-containing signal transduction protein